MRARERVREKNSGARSFFTRSGRNTVSRVYVCVLVSVESKVSYVDTEAVVAAPTKARHSRALSSLLLSFPSKLCRFYTSVPSKIVVQKDPRIERNL